MGKFTQALRQIIRQEMREVLTEELLPILQDVLTAQKRPISSRPKRSEPNKRKTFS